MFYRLGPGIKIGARSKGEAVVRVSSVAQKCVVFFGVKDGSNIRYGGTGFLIGVVERGVHVGYVVTNKHVAVNLDTDFVIRANLLGGGSEAVEIESLPWFYPEDRTIDLAVAPCGLSLKKFNQSYYQIGDDPLELDSCCGDPVSIVGLFRLHKGRGRNVPIVHTGHIAALADRNELVPTKNSQSGIIVDTYAHLVEAQTLDGLSGSPVLIHRFVQLPVKGIGDTHPILFGGISFFGIWQGSWDGAPGEILAADRNLSGKGLRVPVGMGSVIPASCVRELLANHPGVRAHRTRVVDEALAPEAQSQDSGFDESSSDSNPEHREAFNSLLGAAAKTKRPDS